MLKHCLILISILLVPISQSTSNSQVLTLFSNTPLWVEEEVAFAVAQDQRTILTRNIAAEAWEPIEPKLSEGKVTGLASFKDHLYVLSANPPALSILDVEENRWETLLQGSPLQEPFELAATKGSLLIADSSVHSVFRFDPESKKVAILPRLSELLQGSFHIAGSEDQLIVTVPALGKIIAVDFVDYPDHTSYREIEHKQVNQLVRQNINEQHSLSIDIVRKENYQTVERPSYVTIYRGVIYVVDESSGGMFVLSTGYARAIRGR